MNTKTTQKPLNKHPPDEGNEWNCYLLAVIN